MTDKTDTDMHALYCALPLHELNKDTDAILRCIHMRCKLSVALLVACNRKHVGVWVQTTFKKIDK